MIYVDTQSLSKDILKNLAQQIAFMGLQVRPRLFENNKGKIKLAETFPLYSLDITDIQKDPYQVTSVAKPVGYYHQILFNKEALAFAISRPNNSDGQSQPKVTSVTKSKLPIRIYNSVTSLEGYEQTQTSELKIELRLLEIPKLKLMAFWLLNRTETETEPKTEKLLFIHYGLYSRGIDCNTFLEEQSFVDALRKVSCINGIIIPKDKDSPYGRKYK